MDVIATAKRVIPPARNQGLIILGLTPLGIVHTLISLVAVAAGLFSLARQGQISPETPIGKLYLWTTVLTCLTAFGIFQHGGFGPPHALALLTLLVLALATFAAKTTLLGPLGRYAVTIFYSITMLFHFIPAATETFTRLPAGHPLFSGPEDPALQHVISAMFVILIVGVLFQIKHLRSMPARTKTAS